MTFKKVPLERKNDEGCGDVFSLTRELTNQQIAKMRDFTLQHISVKIVALYMDLHLLGSESYSHSFNLVLTVTEK